MENFYQNIERYLLGELEGGDLAAFEKALQSDPALAQSVVQHREMILRLDALRLRNKVNTALLQQDKPTDPKLFYWIFVVAALALTGAGVWYFNQKVAQPPPPPAPAAPPDSLKSMPQNSPEPIAGRPEEKGRENGKRIALARAMHEQPSQTFVRDASHPEGDPAPKTPAQQAAEAYYQQKFQLATRILEDDQRVLDDEGARYIRANARFNIGQFAAAAGDFDALKDSFQFRHEARWNFMLCQIALGNLGLAQRLLNEMATAPDYPFRAKALELQGKLNF